jgi:hypothetical protein
VSAAGETLKDLAPIGAAVLLAIPALWAWMLGVQKRADTKVDAANAERDKWAGRWELEVAARARATVAPAPRHVPESLAPPTWADEDTQVRNMRAEIEQAELKKMKASTLDRSLMAYVSDEARWPRQRLATMPEILEGELESAPPPPKKR